MPSKKRWLLPLLALVELVIIIFLAPANCDPDIAEPKPVPAQRQTGQLKNPSEQPRDDTEDEPECKTDDDCPSDSRCLNENCVIADPSVTPEAEEEFDAGNALETARDCQIDEDCGCGYLCENDLCENMTEPFCCANAECGEGEFCHIGEAYSTGPNGTCMRSECDTSEDCDQCGMRCYNHLCKQTSCCNNNACPSGQLCRLLDGDTEGYCVVPECRSDADCGCGRNCDTEYYTCSKYSERPIQCCGTDLYYEGKCWSHAYIEDGRCLEDKNCPTGQICYDYDVCMPSSCTNNADCGCEAVCRRGHCEPGCDTDADCCDDNYPECDRGVCINPAVYDELPTKTEEY